MPRSAGGRAKSKISREHGQLDLPPVLFVACEGRTEKHIIEQLRGRWRIPSVRVEVVGQLGVPKTLVDEAKRLSPKRSEVWVAFDRDEFDCWDGAILTALARQFHLAVSNPCVELWAILLHHDQTAQLTRHEAQRGLRDEHPQYDHKRNPYFDVETVLRKKDDAHKRAEGLLNSFEAQDKPYRCPTTRFHLLIARLESLKVESK